MTTPAYKDENLVLEFTLIAGTQVHTFAPEALEPSAPMLASKPAFAIDDSVEI